MVDGLWDYLDGEGKIDCVLDVIDKAEIRCLSVSELLEMVDSLWEEPFGYEVIEEIGSRNLSDEEQADLARSVRRLAIESEQLRGSEKEKVDRRLEKLVPILPQGYAFELARELLEHPRKRRRELGRRILGLESLTLEGAVRLIDEYKSKKDERQLKRIIHQPALLAQLDYRFVISSMSERYWRMRVIEALLGEAREAAIALRLEYPFEFTQAAGRAEDESLLPYLDEFCLAHEGDLEYLSIYAWALGKLRSRSRLQKLRERLLQGLDET